MKNDKNSSPFRIALRALEELDIFIELAHVGLGYGGVATKAMQLLRDIETDQKEAMPEPLPEKVKNHASKLETFAQTQLPLDYPYLYELGAIRLWTILESYFQNFLLCMLRDNEQMRELPAVRKLKGPLISFSTAPPQEQAEYILNLLQDEIGAKLRQGVGRFETVLNLIGLSGPVDDTVRRLLFELSEIRNITLHRNGIADRRFITQCPWFQVAEGDLVLVNSQHFRQYRRAISWYILEINRRFTCSSLANLSPESASEERIVEMQQYFFRQIEDEIKTS